MKASFYKYGVPSGEENLDPKDLIDMVELDNHMFEGILVREEDNSKTFYAYPEDIDDEGEGGTGVTRCYAIKK